MNTSSSTTNPAHLMTRNSMVQTQTSGGGVAGVGMTTTAIDGMGRSSELSRSMAIMADAAGPYAKKLIALDSSQPSQRWRQVAPAQINLNTQFNRPLSPGSQGFVGQPLGKNNLGGGFKTAISVSPTQMRMLATQLRKNINKVSPVFVKKGEALVKQRQFKNSKIKQKRSTAGFKFQNTSSSKECRRLKQNEQLNQYNNTGIVDVSLGAMTVQKVQTLTIANRKNHRKSQQEKAVGEEVATGDQVKIYETGQSARPTPSPLAFRLSYSRKTQGLRSHLGTAQSAELNTTAHQQNHGDYQRSANVDTNNSINNNKQSLSPQTMVKEGDCLMIVPHYHLQQQNQQQESAEYIGIHQQQLPENNLNNQLQTTVIEQQQDNDSQINNNLSTAQLVLSQQPQQSEQHQRSSMLLQNKNNQDKDRSYAISIVRLQQDRQEEQQYPLLPEAPQQRRNSENQARFNINHSELNPTSTGVGEYQLNINATAVISTNGSKSLTGVPNNYSQQQALQQQQQLLQHQLDQQIISSNHENNCKPLHPISSNDNLRSQSGGNIPPDAIAAATKHQLMSRTMTAQSPIAKVYEFQIHHNQIKGNLKMAARPNSGGVKQASRNTTSGAAIKQANKKNRKNCNVYHNDGEDDDYIHIVARPMKRPTTGIQTAAFSSTVYNHVVENSAVCGGTNGTMNKNNSNSYTQQCGHQEEDFGNNRKRGDTTASFPTSHHDKQHQYDQSQKPNNQNNERPFSAKSQQTNNYQLLVNKRGNNSGLNRVKKIDSQNRLKTSHSQQRVSLINLMTQKSSSVCHDQYQSKQLKQAKSQPHKGMAIVPLDMAVANSASGSQAAVSNQRGHQQKILKNETQVDTQQDDQVVIMGRNNNQNQNAEHQLNHTTRITATSNQHHAAAVLMSTSHNSVQLKQMGTTNSGTNICNSMVIQQSRQQQLLSKQNRSAMLQNTMRRLLQLQQKTTYQEQIRINQRQRLNQQRKSSVIRGRGGGFINPTAIAQAKQNQQQQMYTKLSMQQNSIGGNTYYQRQNQQMTNLKNNNDIGVQNNNTSGSQQLQNQLSAASQELQIKENTTNTTATKASAKRIYREAVVLPQARIVEQVSSPTHIRQNSSGAVNNSRPFSPCQQSVLTGQSVSKRLTSASPLKQQRVSNTAQHSRQRSRTYRKQQQTNNLQELKSDVASGDDTTAGIECHTTEATALQQSINQLSNIMKQRKEQACIASNAKTRHFTMKKKNLARPTSSNIYSNKMDQSCTTGRRPSEGQINIQIEQEAILPQHSYTAINSGAASPLERFKKIKQSEIATRPSSASQKLRNILAKTNKNSIKKGGCNNNFAMMLTNPNDNNSIQNTFFNPSDQPQFNAQPTALACLYSKSQHKGFQALSKAVSAKSLKQKQNLLKSNQDFALVASLVPAAAANISHLRGTQNQLQQHQQHSRTFKRSKVVQSTAAERRQGAANNTVVNGTTYNKRKQQQHQEAVLMSTEANPYFDTENNNTQPVLKASGGFNDLNRQKADSADSQQSINNLQTQTMLLSNQKYTASGSPADDRRTVQTADPKNQGLGRSRGATPNKQSSIMKAQQINSNRHNNFNKQRHSYGGMLSAMNSMNATERRDRSGGSPQQLQEQYMNDRDALMSESVVSSSLPASYGGIIQNVPALDLDCKNLSGRIPLSNNEYCYTNGGQTAAADDQQQALSHSQKSIQAVPPQKQIAQIKSTFSIKKHKSSSNCGAKKVPRRNSSEDGVKQVGHNNTAQTSTSKGGKRTAGGEAVRRFSKASSSMNTNRQQINKQIVNNPLTQSLQIKQVGPGSTHQKINRHQYNNGIKTQGSSEMIASERVLLSNVVDVIDSQKQVGQVPSLHRQRNNDDYHEDGGARQMTKEESMGATL